MKWNIIIPLVVVFTVMGIAYAIDSPPVWDSDTNSVTHGYIRYEFTPLGAVRIWDINLNSGREELGGALGLAVSGKVGGEDLYALSSDFNWVWWNTTEEWTYNITYLNETNDTIIEWHNVTELTVHGYNLNPDFVWGQEYIFKQDNNIDYNVKIKNTFINHLVNVDDFRVWYINVIEPGTVINFNGNEYIADFNSPLVLHGNLNNLIGNMQTDEYTFSYGDLISNGFNITDIVIGNASVINHPEILIMGIGVQSGDGNFNNGETLIFDPQITGFKSPAETGDPNNDWADGDNITSSDNYYTITNVVNNELDTSNYTFNIPLNSTIHGVLIYLEGKVVPVFGGCTKSDWVDVNLELSWDGGNSYTTPSSPGDHTERFTCTESIQVYGGYNNLYNRAWAADELNNANFTAKLLLEARGVLGNKAYMDHIQISINYTAPAPDILLLEPSNGTTLNTTYAVLNWTIDGTVNDYEVWVYAGNNLTNLADHLVYHNTGVSDGNHIYNFTSPVTQVSDWTDIYALYHLDNLSEFGESNSLVYDFVNGVHNGTPVSLSYPSLEAKLGDSYKFDGGNDYIKIGDGGNFSDVCVNGCTFSAWVNKTDSSGDGSIIGRFDIDGDNQFIKFYITSGESPILFIYENGNSSDYCYGSTEDITINKWHHIVGVYNGSSAVVYRDGIAGSNGPCTSGFEGVNETAWEDAEDTFIGVWDDGNFYGDWIGHIDEVAIWNRSLNYNEIADLYRLGEGKYYWNVTVDYGEPLVITNGTWEFDISSCGYLDGVGDWNVDCVDNCLTLTSNKDLGGLDWILSGNGHYYIGSGINVINYDQLKVENECGITFLT